MDQTLLSYFRKIYPREKNSHKGDYGRIFVLAGSKGMTGAAYLSSAAALRCGAGLVYLGIPESLNTIIEQKLTEIITVPLKETLSGSSDFSDLKRLKRLLECFDLLLAGPGLSMNKATQKLVVNLALNCNTPVVLDADGINSFSQKLLKKKRAGSLILTPHLGEFSRLSGTDIDKINDDKESIALDFAKKFGLTVVLKGYRTVVASSQGGLYINDTGNPGMATAGSGDVLCGVIAALRVQGLSDYEAACLGAYIHGRAGDLAKEQKTELSLIASDILEYLPAVFQELIQKT
ncbi:MAG: NAD(P)H-hydrate dehydratase [Candidatus Omnitrophica bacterium]|nr:NAD(P)H-hydrate dehydratase [Candidatus Omnitrophota bacterium]